MENLHELFTGDRLFLNQERRNLIKRLAVFTQQAFRLLIRNLQNMHDFLVNLCRRHITAIQDCSPVQVLIFLAFQSHQTKLLGHTVLGYHRTRDPGCFFNII